MFNKERKLEIYTERLHRLAFDLALQADGRDRVGIAIVADETRTISLRLFSILENESLENLPEPIINALTQIEYLSFNGWLEMLRTGVCFDYNDIGKSVGHLPLSIILEEIRNVTKDIRALFGIEGPANFLCQPELKRESRVSNSKLFLLQATIGGEAVVENAAYVDEVHTYIEGDPHFGIEDGYFQLRGLKIPVVDCYARFNLDRSHIQETAAGSCMIIVKTAWEKDPALYGVLVDALPQTFGFLSRFTAGESADSRSRVFVNPYARACWDTVDGGQMIFLDWKSLTV